MAKKKDAMFMCHHTVTICDMIHALFLDFRKSKKKPFKIQSSKQISEGSEMLILTKFGVFDLH